MDKPVVRNENIKISAATLKTDVADSSRILAAIY